MTFVKWQCPYMTCMAWNDVDDKFCLWCGSAPLDYQVRRCIDHNGYLPGGSMLPPGGEYNPLDETAAGQAQGAGNHPHRISQTVEQTET